MLTSFCKQGYIVCITYPNTISELILSIKTGSDVSVVIEELPTDYQNEVTTVICRKIRPGHEKDYNDWVRRYLTLERKLLAILVLQ